MILNIGQRVRNMSRSRIESLLSSIQASSYVLLHFRLGLSHLEHIQWVALHCTCSRIWISLCVGDDHTGAVYSRCGSTSITKARFLDSVLVLCMVLLNRFRAFEAAS